MKFWRFEDVRGGFGHCAKCTE